MEIGIIGGTGRMGRLFARVFAQAGIVTGAIGHAPADDLREFARQADVVMVSVPIRETVRVIDTIAPAMTGDQLLCDITSLKEAPVAAMLRSPASVIGLHPMFGPTVTGIAGQTIIATPARSKKETSEWLFGIFRDQGARITCTTPEIHDQMMAVVQGLTHLTTLCMAESMRRLGIKPGDTAPYVSPVYRIETALAGRLVAQDPGLYSDILRMNPYVPGVLREWEAGMAEIAGAVRAEGEGDFESLFRACADHFGDERFRALEETDTLIRSMIPG